MVKGLNVILTCRSSYWNVVCWGFYKSLRYFLSKQEKLKGLIIFQRYWSCRCEHNFYLCVYVFNKSIISLFLKGNTLQSVHNSIFKSYARSWNNEHVIVKVNQFVSLSYLEHFILKGKKKKISTLKLYQFSITWKWKIMFWSNFFKIFFLMWTPFSLCTVLNNWFPCDYPEVFFPVLINVFWIFTFERDLKKLWIVMFVFNAISISVYVRCKFLFKEKEQGWRTTFFRKKVHCLS